ncbi:lanthionine synthetase C family protein [Streptomyces sp. MP131-18]|uniref:lanthionine synthetase C family protein n=1 Tax=Streptomyces sp. MP131-18 TaxID=1857892 RepID=UPI00097C2276|nr:lanthionine synthetase C family protein [Streptomyces sp. MP131-18]ONK13299.1 type 2 lantibiotic biosynthesis protein LanM [Streptomyces sp. MP131-18]
MTEWHQQRAQAAADTIADRLTTPPRRTPDPAEQGRPQSLSKGAAGVALLHIERARAGLGRWDTAHAWLATAVRAPLNTGPNAGLLFGAPALAFAIHAAAESGRYAKAHAALHASVEALARRRLAQAHARIDRGDQPAFREFDTFYGLTGIGVYLLRTDPHHDLTREVLAYLVRLTEPLATDREDLPGWWTDLAPTGRPLPVFPGGHGNFGIAHGITGPLALLSLALRSGLVVEDHAGAIGRICTWLDTWRQDHPFGPWWPETITRDEVRNQKPAQPGPWRPSWCYGTPGLARAQQLAGIATGDLARQRMAEDALLGCLSDPDQLAHITDRSLCHGTAGLFQTVWRAAADTTTPTLAAHLPRLLHLLLDHHQAPSESLGLLTGDAGLALALHTAATGTAPASGWDAFLLLT